MGFSPQFQKGPQLLPGSRAWHWVWGIEKIYFPVDLFPCMRAQSLIILIEHFPINMFLTGFPKAALEKQFYLFYGPEALRDSGVSTCHGLCTGSEKGWVTGHCASKVSMKPSPVPHQVCLCRHLHMQRPQSQRSAQSITCPCAVPLIPCSTRQQET